MKNTHDTTKAAELEIEQLQEFLEAFDRAAWPFVKKRCREACETKAPRFVRDYTVRFGDAATEFTVSHYHELMHDEDVLVLIPVTTTREQALKALAFITESIEEDFPAVSEYEILTRACS